MKWHLLAGTSLLALAAAAPNAGATTFTFTGAIVDFTVPVTGTYQILAFGAQGGSASSFSGGKGAEIGGDFNLTAAEVLQIAVGGAGGTWIPHGVGGGGGGGGSFVIGPGNTPLVIAGGGGGASPNYQGQGGGFDGIAASTSFSGTDGGGSVFHSGKGGNSPYLVPFATGGGYGGGGGGGGFVNGGGDGTTAYGGGGGGGFPSLAGGFANGGFGGGGGGGSGGAFAGGGGGGYNGGGGGSGAFEGLYGYQGGGGGSYLASAAANQILMADVQTADGEVVISELTGAAPVPEPASLALLSTGLAGLAALRRRPPKP